MELVKIIENLQEQELFKTTHDLPFLNRPWQPLLPLTWDYFSWYDAKIGSCKVQWRSLKASFQILGIYNHEPGNGHLQDVFDWFMVSAVCSRKGICVLEVQDERFARHLMIKRQFTHIKGTSHYFLDIEHIEAIVQLNITNGIYRRPVFTNPPKATA